MNDCKAQVIVKLYCDTHSQGNDVVYIIPGSSSWSWITDFSSVSALWKKESLAHRIENTGVARVKTIVVSLQIKHWLQFESQIILYHLHLQYFQNWQMTMPSCFLFQVNILYSHFCELSTQEVMQWKCCLFPTKPRVECVSGPSEMMFVYMYIA